MRDRLIALIVFMAIWIGHGLLCIHVRDIPYTVDIMWPSWAILIVGYGIGYWRHLNELL